MVVHRKDRRKTAIRQKVAWALAASLVATPGLLGAHQGTGLTPDVYAAGEPTNIVMYKGQTSEMTGLSFHDHRIEVSSDALVLNDAEGTVTLQAQHAGTYTVYVYGLAGNEALLDEIQVTVKSHRHEADTDRDGLIDIADIVAYLKINPQVDMNHDGEFDHVDVDKMLGWIDSKYAESNRNRVPEFMDGDPAERYWLQLPYSDTPKPYEPEPIPLNDFFVDLDGDHLSYQIQHVTSEAYADFKIVNNELHYMTREPEANTHDITVVTIRATDEHGAYSDGQFTIERNVPPRFFNNENEVVDLGEYYWDVENYIFKFTPIMLNVDEYFTDPNGDRLSYTPDYRVDGGDFVQLEFDEKSSEMIIDLSSGADMELTLDVTAEDPYGNTTTGTFTATFGERR